MALKRALISGPAASVLVNAFLSAAPYHVPGTEPENSRYMEPEFPADPSTPDVAVHDRSAQLALIVIVGPLTNVAPQTLAANWKALSRC